MAAKNKVIITCAVTGSIHTPSMSPHLPVTAEQMSQRTGLPYTRGSLTDPRYNLAFGQGFIEKMRTDSATAGQLPRVIASYNAGPLPVARWASINDKGDPVLWIESIPYWETRYYVPAVLRNMWVYQGLFRRPSVEVRARSACINCSLTCLATSERPA